MKRSLTHPRYIAGAIVILLTLATSYFVYTNPNLNMAALFHSQETGSDTDVIYVPDYEAEIGESGQLEVKVKNNLDAFDALSFFIEFDPVDGLTLAEDPIVLDNQTLIQSAAFTDATLEEAGLIGVTLLLDEPLAIENVMIDDKDTHQTLFKLEVQVADGLDENTAITLDFKELTVTNDEQLVVTPAIPDSTLNASTDAENKVLLPAKINTVFPDSVSNELASTVLLTGSDLGTVTEVRVGETVVEIEEQFATSIKAKIPGNLTPGTYDITIVDENDNEATFPALLEIVGEGGGDDVVLELSGSAPRIDVDRSYTNPAAAVNDGETLFTLYTFVLDDDQDLQSVIADVSSIAQRGAESAEVFGEDDSLTLQTATCPTDSNTIVCMKPSVKEGKGQWYTLSGLSIRSDVAASTDPYMIEVLAVDAGNNSDQTMLPVYVGTEVNLSAPKPLAAVSTSSTSLEVLFNKPLDADTVTAGAFTVEGLSVLTANLNEAATIVTLSTSIQSPNADHSLQVADTLTDTQGRAVDASDMPVAFEGFVDLQKSPVIDYLSVEDVNLVELEFQNPLLLSSIFDADVSIYEAENPANVLNVTGVSVISSNQIRIVMDTQSANRRYRLSISGLKSYDGSSLPVALNRGFKGYNLQLIHSAANTRLADFDNNLRVDFADFTIFSSVYGTAYDPLDPGSIPTGNENGGGGPNENDQGQVGQPIQDDPDALVPVHSEPDGGEI